ncbi:hypothetical protein GHT06_010331 [Daphnia sinensis]|uniref:C-type lectin domain-containing protein n=1 Tax=Daphnia sinensis TaxID=1820382 RepID=A0AAD5PWV4_9CRUS|nr:hypothetical protein GHT06_010331 [Daphnia sinensis]
MVNIIPIFVILLSTLLISSRGNAVESPRCGGRIFVENTIVIEAPVHEDCHWDIQTQEDRILVITALNGNLKEAQEFLSIHDGSDKDSPILLVENQKTHERSRKDLPEAVYTTQSTASIRFKKAPTSNLQLKIQKAVDCPFNLGGESQCARAVDDVSCYCATFTQRDHSSQTTYCNNNNMKLLTLETYEKEQAIKAAWNGISFWTSLTDTVQEGEYIWESTNTYLYPGYANWDISEPEHAALKDCMYSSWSGRWHDYGCDNALDAICQAIP